MQETVNDVMSKKVVAVLPGDTLEEAARLMKEHDVGVLPVVSGGELKGLVTDRDIVLQCVAAGKEPSQVKAYQIMTKDVVSVSPGQTVSEAARLMGKEQIRRLPVLKDGVIDGMISMADIARRHAARRLPRQFRDQRTVFRNRRSGEDQVIQGGRLRSADAGRRIAGVR